jgi:hypothetical protein
MEWKKLDAALAAAVQDDSARPLVVFATLAGAPDADGLALLRRLGVAEPPERPAVVTLTAGPGDVAELSRRPWVRALSLAQRLDPL